MGMFSPNRTALGSEIDVVANESYIGAAGAYRAMCEGYQNSYAIFEKCIELDFMEAAVVNEGVSETEFAVIQENFATDFFAKIKDFLVKLMEKIKGIIKSFIDKVVGTFTSDGKKLVNKYKAQILKKDLSKMKYKYAKPRGTEIKYDQFMNVYKSQNKYIFEECRKSYKDLKSDYIYNDDKHKADTHKELSGSEGEEKLKGINEKIDDNTYLEKALGATLGKTDGSIELAEYAKEAKEYLFDDVEKEDEGAGSLVSSLMVKLTTSNDTIKKFKKYEKDTTREINEILKEISHTEKEVIGNLPKTAPKMNTIINKFLNTASRLNSQLSTGVSKVIATCIEMEKFDFAQSKRIWVQMASYNPKTVKEDAMLIEAIGEAAEYEAYSSFTEAEMN